MRQGVVGIIANPASGKDIRRLVAHGSSFDNNEKVNTVRRVLAAVDAYGVDSVHYLADQAAIVSRAAQGLTLGLRLVALEVEPRGVAEDSARAARLLAGEAVGCIVTLGGDGTNRVVAEGCGAVPLVPISTGTNNVFPRMIEGTLAGVAAAVVARGVVNASVIRREPRLVVRVDGEVRTTALIDVAAVAAGWIGARALWDPRAISEIVTSRVRAAEIGLAGLAGWTLPEAPEGMGAYLRLGEGGRRVLAPLAPGLIAAVAVVEDRMVAVGQTVRLRAGPCVLAVDGERELEVLDPQAAITVELTGDGPLVVDIEAAIRAGAAGSGS